METSTANVSAKDAMALRQRTGLGIMNCKKALAETNGDMDAAEQKLREKMKGKMDTRTDRAAGEGCVAITIEANQAVILEARSETDFTARNENFIKMADDIARHYLTRDEGMIEIDDKAKSFLDEVRITTNENVSIHRARKFEGGNFASYLHHDRKLGVVMQVEGVGDPEVLTGICQHIAAHVPTPVAVDESDMPREMIDEHKAIAEKEAEESGKPKDIAEKIAEGKMRKFFEEHTLLGQKYVRDDKKSVSEIIPEGVKINQFARYIVGGD